MSCRKISMYGRSRNPIRIGIAGGKLFKMVTATNMIPDENKKDTTRINLMALSSEPNAWIPASSETLIRVKSLSELLASSEHATQPIHW